MFFLRSRRVNEQVAQLMGSNTTAHGYLQRRKKFILHLSLLSFLTAGMISVMFLLLKKGIEECEYIKYVFEIHYIWVLRN